MRHEAREARRRLRGALRPSRTSNLTPPTMRVGKVTQTDPLEVATPAGEGSSARSLVGPLREGQVVWLLVSGGSRVVVGSPTLYTDWTGLAYKNGWADFGGGFEAGQWRHVPGGIEVVGFLARSGTSRRFADLPPEATPDVSVVRVAGTDTGAGGSVNVLFDTDGEIRINTTTEYSSFSDWLTLDVFVPL